MYAELKRKRFVGFLNISAVKSVNERGPQLVSKEPRSTAEFSRAIA
ncbi:hypothetical protein IQ26_01919 [Mesorhizobium tianshanense]|uniref:Uncharacterized protein n=1 Tax=Mesorhizobium tianshanense TaxID=39844 RepID=A0A562P5K1_9HYPH|nr:hypothetical protein IQ26_01919 [Mesorhizobium tianshanense]